MRRRPPQETPKDIYISNDTSLPVRIVLTKHAHDAMIDRGVSITTVRLVLERGSKTKQTEGLLATYGYVSVAYRVQTGTYVVKTVMVAGGK